MCIVWSHLLDKEKPKAIPCVLYEEDTQTRYVYIKAHEYSADKSGHFQGQG